MSASTEFAEKMKRVRKRLHPDDLATIREAHDLLDFDCAAHDNGRACCVDWLLSDDGPELHQISPQAAWEMRNS